MSRDRFLHIKTNLKCSKVKDKNPNDAAWRVRAILDLFAKTITSFGFFETALSVDEMMVKFYGRLNIKQYIRNKPVRFGVKMWGLCGADGFLFKTDIYCGKNGKNSSNLNSCALGSRVVLNMGQDLLLNTIPKKLDNYHIYFDNFFCNPDLIVHLKKVGVVATGTVRQDRVKEKNTIDVKSSRGTHCLKHDTNSGVNYITIMDSKIVSMLSTAVGDSPLKSVKRYSKDKKDRVEIPMPAAFALYNRFMGGVDIHDQYCSKLLPSLRSKKWTWPVLMRLIQSSITNAVIIFNAAQLEGKKSSAKEFAMQIAENYLAQSSSRWKSHELMTHEKKKKL
ncbi:piggyBac transposable element-derived protein 3-like [Leptopilina heterotoma]|uniref:piggyBac transposable element-derived protein 3-like n=1 Tax=Leptopilina heterotoma TaxID=63436 RepID=UPI001CA9C16B|nr:piggyBac transposable element-derived protein 3-like [Leptopilina heterotoma]